ncbi:MAG: cupredoxin domain-containing protein [Acidimicrobiia bacterium]
MRTRRLLLALSMVMVFTACGGDDDDTGGTAAGGTDATAGASLTIAGSAFSPQELSVPAGDIEVTNEDGFAHTVTADDGAFDVRVEGGDTASITVETPGTYPFHCSIHSSMTGTIVVS